MCVVEHVKSRILKVEDRILKVEDDIEDAKGEANSAAQTNDVGERDYWRKVLESVRKELEQLRKELEQLRDKEARLEGWCCVFLCNEFDGVFGHGYYSAFLMFFFSNRWVCFFAVAFTM